MNFSKFTAQNLRKTQEDRSVVYDAKDYGTIFGVFDGHGGHAVSEYAAANLGRIFESLADSIKANPKFAIEKIFQKLVLETLTYEEGSTAIIAWVKDNKAVVGALGDSTALIRTAKGELWQSPEHNVRSNSAEAKKAMLRGGFISKGYLFDMDHPNGPGVQVSRVLGDFELSKVLNRRPEVFEINLSNQSWILLSSDGLIDASHKDNDILPIIVQFIEGNDADAELLVTAMANIYNHDNSTAVLIRMDETDGNKQP